MSVDRPTEQYNTLFKKMVVPGFKAILEELAPGKPLEAVRKAAAGAFRQRGAQSRPIVMHGLDLITSLPFISVDEVRSEPYDMTMQPGMTYSMEITPVNADGTFGIFFSRSYAITDSGVREFTPFSLDEIIVAG